jgi:hypothetical protein
MKNVVWLERRRMTCGQRHTKGDCNKGKSKMIAGKVMAKGSAMGCRR